MATSYPIESNALIPHRSFLLYAAEGVNSFSATLLTAALPFFTSHRFGWGARENFAVAALQGLFYMFGALLAQKISRRWGRENSLLGLYAGLTVCTAAVAIIASMGWAVAAVILIALEMSLMAASWPMLESLISGAGEPSQLSKRLGWYNIVWAIAGALTVAASGAIIQHTPVWGFFAFIAAGHILAGVLIFYRARLAVLSPVRISQPISIAAADPISNQAVEDPERFDEAVVRRHRLALWLSRIALPSTYVIIFSLVPALPSLHVIKQLSPTIATAVASIWFLARAITFVVTGHTTFWHKRPSLMFFASVTMLIAFIGVIIFGVLTETDLLKTLAAMAIAQIVLGFSIGIIYSASLYFGMAVSEGSTEHGGYHEALIGLGQILGPLAGAVMQWIRPDELWPAVIGISGIVSITIAVEAVVGIRISAKKKLTG